MSLQVKLRHPLGEKLVELEPRTSDDPVVIGRQVGAQIQVPSVSVSPRHSVMFVYEGRWVVQDSGETTGTFVNGQPIEGAVFLQIGDVIKLGAEPRSPTIQIDPQGATEGRTGYAMAGTGAVRTVSAPQPRAAAARPVGGGGYAPPGYGQSRSPYGAAATAVATPVAQPVGDSGNGDDIAWPAEASSSSAASSRSAFARPKQTSSSGAPIAIAIVVGIVIIIGTVWAVYTKMHPAPAPTAPIAAKVQKVPDHPAIVKDNSHASGSIFDEGVVDKSGKKGVAPPAAKALPTIGGNPVEIAVAFGPGKRSTAALPIPKAPSSASEDSGKPAAPVIDEDDPRFKTKDWERLDQLRYSPAYLEALLAYEKYEVDHPGQLTAQVNLLREVTLDRLWFARIDTLFKKRDDITTRMRDYDQQIADEPNEVFRKNTLLPEKQALQKKLNAVNDLLVKEMGYTASNPPNPDDDAELEELRKLRDRDYYAQWKKRVINSVHKQRLLPWVD